jgi:two-component system sensor histidine kinase/response regulator
MSISWKEIVLPLVAAVLVAALVTSVVVVLDDAERQRHLAEQQEFVRDKAATVRARTEQALYQRLHLVRSLIALVRNNPDITQAEFEDAAGAAAHGITGLRALTLARDAVASHFYPLTGNETAVGHDLLADPARREIVLQTIRSGRFRVHGPVTLRQGGQALIGRQAIMFPAAPGKDPGERFWGLAIVMIDLETVLAEAGLIGSDNPAVDFALRGRDGMGAAGELFFGPPELFASEPVLADIELPSGSWQLAAVPRGGWLTDYPEVASMRALGALFAGFCSFFVWRLVRDPIRLRRQVAAARRDILLSEGRHALLADSIEDYAIFMLAPDGTIASWNNGARRIRGHAAEEVIGHPFHMFFDLQAVADGEPDAQLREACHTGRCLREGWHRRRDGSCFPGLTTLAAIRDDEDRLLGYSVVTHDLTHRVDIESRMHASNRRFQDIVEIAGEFIWEVDAEGRFLFVSERVREVLGYAPLELIGRRLFELLVPEDAARMAADPGDRRGPTVAVRSEEYRCIGRNGHIVWLWGSRTPIVDPDGAITGYRGVALNVTEQKAIEERLRRAVGDLERSNAVLARFAEVAAHDLQEPLRIIVSFAHLLERRYRGQLDAEADEFIDFIVEGGTRMKSLIQDLLRYSMIDRAPPPVEAVGLQACIQTVLRDLRETIDAAGAKVEVSADEAMVRANARQIVTLFRNLLVNALEYRSPDRAPAIRIELHPVATGWECTVTDNGIGIEPQYFERIFQIFERLHGQRVHPGTGIGLAICRKIVERHGGRIWVASDFGSGSRFGFTLPGLAANHHAVTSRIDESSASEQ